MKFFKSIFKSNIDNNNIKNIEIEKTDIFQPGEFDFNCFPESYRNGSFYFYKYCRLDGEWIEEGEKICILRINEVDNNRFQSAIISASKSGFLEWTMTENQTLESKMVFYKLHEKGNYINENSTDNSEYKHFFYIDETKHTFKKWLKLDGSYVKRDEDIYQFKILKDVIKTAKAEKDGFLFIVSDKIYNLEKGQLMYYILDNDEIRTNQKFINKPNIIIDDFKKSTKIEWIRVSTKYQQSQGVISTSDDYLIHLTFTFNFNDTNDYIVFHFNPKEIKIRSNDKINLLFDDGQQIEFTFIDPITSKNFRNENIVICKSLITKSELELFANLNLKKWKITLTNDNREILGGSYSGDDNYHSKDLVIVVKKFANDYIKLVYETIPNYQALEMRSSIITDNKRKSNYCSVYLMHDTTNGFYKIGISNNPEYREKTLQSEKPTIEMIGSKKFPIRKIAESFEKSLHGAYSEKRIRGEWFALNSEDVKHIKESLEY